MKQHLPIFRTLFAGLLVMAAGIASTSAVLVTVPADLNPGDQYRLVFVTNAGVATVATSSNIGTYDAVVAAEAAGTPALNSLSATWVAIASVAGLDARDHTGTNPFVDGAGVPIYGLDGTRIVDDNSDFWDGTLDTQIFITPNEAQAFGFTSWTGSTAAGVGSPGFRLGDSSAQIGFSAQTDADWIQSFTGGTTVPRGLYGISNVLTVVPEPSASLLILLGAGAIVLRRRR